MKDCYRCKHQELDYKVFGNTAFVAKYIEDAALSGTLTPMNFNSNCFHS